MKKWICLTLIVCLLLPCLSGCDYHPDEHGKSVSITMEEIVNANSTAALLERYDNFLIEYAFADGSRDMRYTDGDLIFVDKEKYDMICTEYTRIYEQEGEYKARLFAGVPQDLSWSDWLTVDDEDTLTEIIEEAYEEDGKIYVTTTLPREQYDTDMQDASLLEKVSSTYVLDAETYAILECDTTYTYTSGKTEITRFKMKVNVEEPMMLTRMRTFVTPGASTRDLTVVLDPDTENETSYTVTFPKDGWVEFYYPSDYSEPYIDRACTVLMTDELDTTENLTVYIKKVGYPVVDV